MQNCSFATRTILAIAGIALAAPATQAQLPYADGDLLLGFRATGGFNGDVSYVVNLGAATNFTNLAPGAVLQLDTELGNIKLDLEALYTSGPTNWLSRGDLLWSVSGVQRFIGNGWPTNNTMFATNVQTGPAITLGLQNSTAWTRLSAGGAGTYALQIQALGEQYLKGDGGAFPNGNTESVNSPFALTMGAGTINSYRSFMPNGVNTTGATAYSLFGGATGIEGSFANGTAGVALDLYTLQTGSSGSPGTFEGTFSINSDATVTFTSAIPEPSSAIALALGATVLGSIRRRRPATR